MYYQSSNPRQNNNNDNFKYKQQPVYRHRYLPTYQAFIIDNSVQVDFLNFTAKTGRTYTKVIFHIPGIPEFAVLDFDWNGANRLLKIKEGKFSTELLATLNDYCTKHPEPTALVKKVPETPKNTTTNPAVSDKDLNMDHIFDEFEKE